MPGESVFRLDKVPVKIQTWRLDAHRLWTRLSLSLLAFTHMVLVGLSIFLVLITPDAVWKSQKNTNPEDGSYMKWANHGQSSLNCCGRVWIQSHT